MSASALYTGTAANLHSLDRLLFELELELDPKVGEKEVRGSPLINQQAESSEKMQSIDRPQDGNGIPNVDVIDFYISQDNPKETPSSTCRHGGPAVQSPATERSELKNDSNALPAVDLATLRAQAEFAESLCDKELHDLMHELDIDQRASDSMTEDEWTYSATSDNVESDISNAAQFSEATSITSAMHMVPTRPLKVPKPADISAAQNDQLQDAHCHHSDTRGRIHDSPDAGRRSSRRSRPSRRQTRRSDHDDETRSRRRIELLKRPSKTVKTDAKLRRDPAPQTSIRIFIEDARQSVEIAVPTDARTLEIIAEVRHAASNAQVAFTMDASADWTLFEILPAYGLERAVRHYEVLSTILETWDPIADKDNALLVKKYAYSESLRLQAIPRSMPKQEMSVRLNVKKSKWVKSCVELKEHGLFIAKKANAKDSEFLCAMSYYDVYTMNTPPDGSPTAYVMALKAQDPIRMFEDPDKDFLHLFALDSAEQLRNAVLTLRAARSFLVGTKALLDLERMARSNKEESVRRSKSASSTSFKEQRLRPVQSQANLPKLSDNNHRPSKRSPSAHIGRYSTEGHDDDKDEMGSRSRSDSCKVKRTLLDRICNKEAAEMLTGRRMDLAIAPSFMGESVPSRGRSHCKSNLKSPTKCGNTLVDLNQPELYAEGTLLAKGGVYAQKKVEAVLQKCGELEAKVRPSIYSKSNRGQRRNL